MFLGDEWGRTICAGAADVDLAPTLAHVEMVESMASAAHTGPGKAMPSQAGAIPSCGRAGLVSRLYSKRIAP